MARPNVRQQIVEGGLQTFHLQGFHGCTVQDITTAAGVPKGSFYNHFESKEALALNVLDVYWDLGTDRLAALSDQQVEPVKRLRVYFEQLSESVAEGNFRRGCLIGNFSTELSAHNEAARDKLASLFATWARGINGCVQDAVDAGRVVPQLPAQTISSFLLNSWEGAVLRAKVEQDRTPLLEFTQVVFASIFK